MDEIIFYDDHINFLNQSFPCRRIRIHGGNPDFENCFYLIASSSLNSILFDNNGQYISLEAKYIDEQIFFYVDNIYFSMDDEKLNEIVIQNIV